jgi:hypothetical protein
MTIDLSQGGSSNLPEAEEVSDLLLACLARDASDFDDCCRHDDGCGFRTGEQWYVLVLSDEVWKLMGKVSIRAWWSESVFVLSVTGDGGVD